MTLKKYIGATIILMMVVCPIIFYTTLTIHKHIVRWKMEERLEKASLQTITVKKNAFSWIKINKEIEVGGKLFDVKSHYSRNNEVVFKGIFDDDEKKIIDTLNLLLDHKKTSSIAILQLLKIILLPVIIDSEKLYIDLAFKHRKEIFFTYNEVAVSLPLPIYFPPPNL